MKLNSKQVSKIAGIMVVTGIGISAIALIGGAKPSISMINGEIILSNPFTDTPSKETFSDQSRGVLENQVTPIVGASKEYTNLEENLKAFKTLEIEVDTMNVNILPGDEYKIEVNYRKDTQFGYEVRGTELIIEQKDHSNWKNSTGKKYDKGYVNIYIPEKTIIEYADIAMGMGSNEIEDVQIDELELACGMGSVNLNNVIMDTAYIDGGMGNISGRDIVSNGLEINMGMGSVDIQGDLRGTIDIDGGMGELKIATIGKEADYNYDISKGMGTIHINGQRQSVLEDVNINNHADNDIIIDGGMGSISVKTE